MTVDVHRGRCLVMADPLADRLHVHVLVDQERDVRVPELVHMDLRKICQLGHPMQLLVQSRLRVEDQPFIPPNVHLLNIIPDLVMQLLRDFDVPDGALRLRRLDHAMAVDHHVVLRHMDHALTFRNVPGCERQKLSLTQAGPVEDLEDQRIKSLVLIFQKLLELLQGPEVHLLCLGAADRAGDLAWIHHNSVKFHRMVHDGGHLLVDRVEIGVSVLLPGLRVLRLHELVLPLDDGMRVDVLESCILIVWKNVRLKRPALVLQGRRLQPGLHIPHVSSVELAEGHGWVIRVPGPDVAIVPLLRIRSGDKPALVNLTVLPGEVLIPESDFPPRLAILQLVLRDRSLRSHSLSPQFEALRPSEIPVRKSLELVSPILTFPLPVSNPISAFHIVSDVEAESLNRIYTCVYGMA